MAKGIGKYSWTMTLFHPGNSALEQFQAQVLDIWQKPSDERSSLRIRYQIEWTDNQKGAAVNAKTIAKLSERERVGLVNPLKDFLK